MILNSIIDYVLTKNRLFDNRFSDQFISIFEKKSRNFKKFIGRMIQVF